MANGFRRGRGGDEYVFVDGVAVRATQEPRVELSGENAAPGQQEERPERNRPNAGSYEPQVSENMKSLAAVEGLLADERRSTRRKRLVFLGAFVVVLGASLCVSAGYYGRFYNPIDVAKCLVQLPRLFFVQLFDYPSYAQAHYSVMQELPMYDDFVTRVILSFKYVVSGILLAVSGMLYQNTFRNPIAAPSMLGVSNGINMALVILVLQFGYLAPSMIGHYYLYSFIGGGLILGVVLVGGRLVSAGEEFNVANMILIGTIVSQMLGVLILYLQTIGMDDQSWEAYRILQSAVGLTSIWTYVTLGLGLVVSLLPIIVFRFRLNLVSFSDAEVRLLGANPAGLRLLALACGSLMILIAQVNVGQVAMASLVLPFVSRAVFGSEFRKQLVGNVLLGATLLLFCGDLASLIHVNSVPLDVGTIVTVVALPLFVWMLAIRQRNWE